VYHVVPCRPGTAHVCHSHPSYVYYVLSGGKAEVKDDKGTRKADLATGASLLGASEKDSAIALRVGACVAARAGVDRAASPRRGD